MNAGAGRRRRARATGTCACHSWEAVTTHAGSICAIRENCPLRLWLWRGFVHSEQRGERIAPPSLIYSQFSLPVSVWRVNVRACLSCVLRRDVRVASNVFERSNQLTTNSRDERFGIRFWRNAPSPYPCRENFVSKLFKERKDNPKEDGRTARRHHTGFFNTFLNSASGGGPHRA